MKKIMTIKLCLNISLILLFLSSFSSFAQTITIQGTVKNAEDGMPIPGVNVLIKGTSNGIVTDFDGNYTIKTDKGSVLVFSYIGMKPQSVTVGNNKTINIQMESDLSELDEVVVIGYGTTTKKDLTGAVSSISAVDLQQAQSGNLFTSLQGKLSGVQITPQSGDPLAGFNVVIRGANSINSGTSPLYIVDGVQIDVNDDEYSLGSDSASSANPLSFLNPEDIQSMDVLKDASATSIYGARGANGVVIITTRTAKKGGRSRFNFSTSSGVTLLSNTPNPLSAQEYINRAFLVEDNLNYGTDTDGDGINDTPGDANSPNFTTYDYEDMLVRTGYQDNYNLSYIAATDQTRVSAGIGYSRGKLLVKNNTFDRLSLNMKVDHDFNKKISIGGAFNYGRTNRNGVASDAEYNDFTGLFQRMYVTRPAFPVNSDDPDDEDVGSRVVNSVFLDKKILHNTRLLGSVYLKFNFSEKFNLRLEGNTNITNAYSLNWKDVEGSGFRDNGWGQVSDRSSIRYDTRALFNYQTKIKKHGIKLLQGFEFRSYDFQSTTNEASSFDNDALEAYNLSFGALQIPVDQTFYDNKTESAFGRIDYNYDSRYYLTASYRLDGSSVFGDNNKVGFFPSVAVSWNVSEEKFMENQNFISNFKIRASAGTSGNDRIPAYRSLSSLDNTTYATLDGGFLIGVIPSVFGNPDLKWETTTAYNIGLDLALLNNRINITAEVYRKDTDDMLLLADIPAHTGLTSQWQNIGSVRNEGWEVLLKTTNISTKNFTWTTDININAYRSEVLDLGEIAFLLTGGSGFFQNISRIEEGQSLNLIYGYKTNGILQINDFNWQNDSDPTIPFADRVWALKDGIPVQPGTGTQPGDANFVDVSGPDGEPDGLINADDQTFIGDATPKFFGGINNTFNFRNLDISFFFKYSVGNDLFYGLQYYNTSRPNFNRDRDFIAEEWSFENQDARDPRYNWNNNREASDVYIHDGSFLRLQSATIGYTFPKELTKKLNINRCRMYITGNNLFTVTNYPGTNPDIGSRGLFSGFDNSTFPVPIEAFVGLQLSF